jgi:hypothetical protein
MSQTLQSLYSPEEIGRAMKAANGDYRLAAEALGMPPNNLHMRLQNNPQLRALYIDRGKKDVVPTDIDVMTRDGMPMIKSEVVDSLLAKAMDIQNRDLLNGGLARAGIKQKTLDKLSTLGSATESAGKFLIASLDLSHRMMIYLNVSLLEQAEEIRETYLTNPSCPSKDKLEWQRVYNGIVSEIGKCYDRTLAGTAALVKITTGKSEREQKPGFRTLQPTKKIDPEPNGP